MKIVRKCNGSFNSEYLSKDNTNSLKGIFALLILIHHTCLQTGLGMIPGLRIFIRAFGFWGVSIFLFISGYGLMKSYASQGQSYISNFLRNRLLPIYLLNVLLIIIYSLEKVLLGIPLLKTQIIQSFFIGYTVVRYGWYLQMIEVMYFVFYLSFKYVREKNRQLIAVVMGSILYCLFCELFDLPYSWYECTLCFPLGLYYAAYQDEIDTKNVVWLKILTVSMFVLFFAYNVLKPAGLFCIPIKMLQVVFFVLVVIMSLKNCSIKNRVTKFLGKYYMEIYVLQGLVLTVLQVYPVNNPFLEFIIGITVSIMVAVFMKGPMQLFINCLRAKSME